MADRTPHQPGLAALLKMKEGPMPEQSAYRVVIIGAGFGGIGMALALKQAGIEDFLVVDRAGDLGGTWRDNTYPGLACDVPSNLYSFSFRPGRWSRRFPPRQEILAYLHALASERGLGPHLRFGSGVAAADFDERRAVWNLMLEDGGTLRATAVVSAVGQLNRPALPLGPVEARCRPRRAAGGRGGHRGKRHPVRARGRQGRRPRRRLPAQRPLCAAQVRSPLWAHPAGPLRPVPGAAQGRPAAHLPLRRAAHQRLCRVTEAACRADGDVAPPAPGDHRPAAAG